MSYNFEENIKKLSYSNNIDDIPHEWLFLGDNSGEDRCICNRSIKNCYYFYNIITKKFITAGSSCQKKLKLSIKKPIDIETIIDFEKGDYKEIKDFVAYSNYTKTRIIRLFNNKLDKFKQFKTLFNFDDLDKLNKYINLLRYLSKKTGPEFTDIYNQFVNYKKTCIINTWKEVFIRWNKQEQIKKERIEMEKKRFEAEKKAREKHRREEQRIDEQRREEQRREEQIRKEEYDSRNNCKNIDININFIIRTWTNNQIENNKAKLELYEYNYIMNKRKEHYN
jgi:hypothetical protein